ncbi:MAG: TonB-dependent receptor [Azospirillaceae bacterium]|nr:TonB-dependent receptor [Azospirillaceae bacterium]
MGTGTRRGWARGVVVGTAGLALMALAPAAGAQTAAADDGGGLQEIIVTAQKRQEKLSDIPLAMSALSSDTLNKLAATQFRDFASVVPGLNFTSSGPGETQLNLRGVTTGTNTSPTVAVYVDDVPYGSSTAFVGAAQMALDVGLFDLDRVEVLRGPQGTLYGASSMGGLLKYVTHAPELDRFGGADQLGVSTTAHGGTGFDVNSVINAPVVDGKVAVRASGYYNRDAGYVDNIALGQHEVNEAEIYGGRLDVLAKLTEALDVRLTGFAQDIHRDGTPTYDASMATGQPITGYYQQSRLLPEGFDQQVRVVSGTANYDLGEATITSITSYQSNKSTQTSDISALYVPLLSAYGLNLGSTGLDKVSKTDKFTQELRVASSGKHFIDWMAGGFYTHEDSDQTQSVPSYDTAGQPSGVNLLYANLPSTYEEYAFFGNATVHVTDRFEVGGGVRYSNNNQKFQQIATGMLASTYPSATSSDSVATYVANARYSLTDQISAYARAASGYRPGGPNFVANDPATGKALAAATFAADTLWSYEAALRAETEDKRFSIDAALYLINWDNMQVAAIRNGLGVIANASSAQIKGAELTLAAKPVRDLTLTGTVSVADAELAEDAPDLGGLKGDRLPDTPKLAATLLADYGFDVGNYRGGVGATVRYVSQRVSGFNESAGQPQFHLPAYATLDLRASLGLDAWDAQLYCHNLLDRRGLQSADTTLSVAGGPARLTLIQPRTVGLTLSTHF